MYKFFIVLLIAIFISFDCTAQKYASTENQKGSTLKEDRLSLLLYARVITDANGNFRVDENIVPNLKLNKLLRLEAGIRFGERTYRYDSYYHYKVELQSRSFWNTIRFLARVSDNVIQYPTPVFGKSNFLVVAEAKQPISHSFVLLVAYGYVFSFVRDNSLEGLPSTNGSATNYPTFKIALRYLIGHKGFIEGVYGAYDVFNPYLLSSPFLQTSFEYELSKRSMLYSYFRYQYNANVSVPLNDFLGLGVKLSVIKTKK